MLKNIVRIAKRARVVMMKELQNGALLILLSCTADKNPVTIDMITKKIMMSFMECREPKVNFFGHPSSKLDPMEMLPFLILCI
jgi:hypothetical protein